MQIIQQTLVEIQEKESAPPRLLIDGKEIAFPVTNLYKVKHNDELQPLPHLRFETFAAKFKREELSMLSQAQSISILWDKAVIVIPPVGIENLHQFMANEYEWLLKRQ